MTAVDNDADCIETLIASKAKGISIAGWKDRHYLEAANLMCRDLTDVTASDLRPKRASAQWRPDLLAGGPPCQPFSSAGRMRGLDDPRGRLFQHFVRLASELRPRFILFENVAGLVTARSPKGKPGGVLQTVQQAFEQIGYACRFALLNAADYGAPQRRVRLYMIAASNEALPEFPSPTHERGAHNSNDLKLWVSLRAFLAERPKPDTSDVVRPSARRLPELMRLTPGTGVRATGIVEANRPGGHWGYRQDCFLADLGLPARTIRAASTPDWILLPGQGLRRLTWRECAGLQGFPPAWEFVGTNASRFRQIGNAVEGHVGRAIARVFSLASLNKQAANPASPPWPPAFHKRVRYTAMEDAVNGSHRAAAKSKKAS